jgi:CHAT domain-containing protein/Tfp pilus assembly protein PilF
MHFRNNSFSAAGWTAVATALFAVALGCMTLHAQAPGSAAVPPATSLPVEVQAKRDKLDADVKTARAAGDSLAEAKALNRVGDLALRLSDTATALKSYTDALTAAQAAKDAHEQAEALIGLGHCRRVAGQNQPALQAFLQAMNLAAGANDLQAQAQAMDGAGWVAGNVGQSENALKMRSGALELAQKLGDPELLATTLNQLGTVYDNLSQGDKALDLYNQALPLWRAAGDAWGEANSLNNIGILYAEQGNPAKALEYFNQVLPLRRGYGDRAGEASTLNNIGILYKQQGQLSKALDEYEQALPVERAVGNRSGEASVLTNIGNIDSITGEAQKALDAYGQALVLQKAMDERVGEAGTLNNIAEVLSQLGQKQKALDQMMEALVLWRDAGNRRGEASTLNLIGVFLDDLGQTKGALDYYTQALTIRHDIGDKTGEAEELSNLAGIYSNPGEEQKALDYYSRALALQTTTGDEDGQARSLNNMGLVYEDLGDKRKALDYYNQSLQMQRMLHERAGESNALDNIGGIYDALGEKQKALDYYMQALQLAMEVGDPVREAQVYHNLMQNQKEVQPALAVFYGKQAVNFVQQVRGNLQGLDKRMQASFVATKGSYYHDLADLLIARGRLPEAQQVADLLKQQEFHDYVRGETTDTLGQLTLTPAEKQAEQDYETSTAQIVALGERWSELNRLDTRTPDQEKEWKQLSDQLDGAGKGLDQYYARLYSLFGQGGDANQKVEDVKAGVSALGQEIADSPHTVALYTLVGKDRTSVIVITGSTEVARQVTIGEEELNRKVAAFQQALRQRSQDPRPAAQELYKILVAPVQADLDQARAETLVWSLDGVLRYVPMAALYDGKQYLVERYSTVTITPASIPHLADKPDVSRLSVSAMGISRKYEDALPALPAVVGELDEIVEGAPGSSGGVLPGTILLDGDFTEKAMEDQLRGQHQVLHIASHFVFKPGDDSQSYLLLAGKDESTGGFHLTVADFNSDRNLNLRRTDLLTLSACETGMSGSASNGREVDGLGTTAQLKGAKAVISSLWEVDDVSTGQLMGDFYKRWADGKGKVAKVEALRQAQLDLLRGKAKTDGDARGRGIGTEPEPGSEQPRAEGFAHPYYWAPFVLMGNWR